MTVIEEPMYAAIRDTVRGWKQHWRQSNLPPFAQGLLIVVAVMAALVTIEFWAPLGVMLAIFYAIYYVVWSVMLRPGLRAHARRMDAQRPEQPPPASFVSANQENDNPFATRGRKQPWRQVVHSQLAARTFRQRLTSLLGSMLVSGVLCVLVSAVLVTVAGAGTGDSWQALHLWFAVVATLGCWGVLLTNSLTEGRVEDQAPMRAILLGVGALVGLAAFWLTSGLSLELPHNRDFGPPPNDSFIGALFNLHNSLRSGWSNGSVAPSLPISMFYFALLFALPRWWRLAEFTRQKRLSLWSVLGLVIWAWVLHVLWWYPQPIGMALAATVAIVTQLSSPWFPPSKRLELAKQRAAI